MLFTVSPPIFSNKLILIRTFLFFSYFRLFYGKPVLQSEIKDVFLNPGDVYSFIPPLSTFSSNEYIQYSISHNSFVNPSYIGIGNQTGEYSLQDNIIVYNDFQVDDGLMYTCSFSPGGLVIYDLDDKNSFTEPIILSNISSSESCWGLSLDVNNSIVFTINSNGISSFNVSNPSNPILLDHLNITIFDAQRQPTLAKNRLFFCENEMAIILNTSNPFNISLLARFYSKGGCLHISITTDRIYISGEEGIVIYDIGDTSNITYLSQFNPVDFTEYASPVWSYVLQTEIYSKNPNFLFLCGYQYYKLELSFVVLNVSNLSDIHVSYYPLTAKYNCYSFVVEENYVYIQTSDGLEILDISNIDAIQRIEGSNYELYNVENERGLRIYDNHLFYLGNRRSYIVGYHFGIKNYFPTSIILDVSNKTGVIIACEECGGFYLSISNFRIMSSYGYLFSKATTTNYGSSRNSILIFNISGTPSLVNLFPLDVYEKCFDIIVDENEEFLYIAEYGSIVIFNISDKLNPMRIGFLPLGGSDDKIEHLIFEDDILYAFSSKYLYYSGIDDYYQYSLFIINATERANPDLIVYFPFKESIYYKYEGHSRKSGDLIIVTLKSKEIFFIDVSDPAFPHLIYNFEISYPSFFYSSHTAIVGNYFYLGCLDEIQTIDIRNPIIDQNKWKDSTTYIYDMKVTHSDIVFFTESKGELEIYDFSNKSSPHLIQHYSLKINPKIYVVGNKIHIFTRDSMDYEIRIYEIGQINITGIPNNTTDCGSNIIKLRADDGQGVSMTQFNIYVECPRCFDVFVWNGEGKICSGSGNCTSLDHCDCDDNYFGKLCNVTSCYGELNNVTNSNTTVCGNHGACIFSGFCTCHFGWHGDFCSYDLFELEQLIESTNKSLSIRMCDLEISVPMQCNTFENKISESHVLININISEKINETKNSIKKEIKSATNQVNKYMTIKSEEFDKKLSSEIVHATQTINSRLLSEVNQLDLLVTTLNNFVLSTCQGISSTDPSVCSGRGICILNGCFCSDGYGGGECHQDLDGDMKEKAESESLTYGSITGSISLSLFLLIGLFFFIFLLVLFLCCCIGTILFLIARKNKEKINKFFGKEKSENTENDNIVTSEIKESQIEVEMGSSSHRSVSTDGEWVSEVSEDD